MDRQATCGLSGVLLRDGMESLQKLNPDGTVNSVKPGAMSSLFSRVPGTEQVLNK